MALESGFVVPVVEGSTRVVEWMWLPAQPRTANGSGTSAGASAGGSSRIRADDRPTPGDGSGRRVGAILHRTVMAQCNGLFLLRRAGRCGEAPKTGLAAFSHG